MSEARLVGNIMKAIKKEYPDAWIFKTVGGMFQMPGVPDLLVCIDGLLIGMEVKFQRPGESEAGARGRVTVPQQRQIKNINKAGGFASSVLSVDEALDVIDRAFLKHERRKKRNGTRDHEH